MVNLAFRFRHSALISERGMCGIRIVWSCGSGLAHTSAFAIGVKVSDGFVHTFLILLSGA
jgi:hypothetical protein